MAIGDYAGAAEILRSELAAVEGRSGPGVDKHLPATLGGLGSCLFEMGDGDGAVAPFERALALCEANGDDEGVYAYLSNLYEVHRYRGDATTAAAFLERRAALSERGGHRAQAARDRAQARIVRAGEPPCRVVADIGGELVEIAEVPSSVETVRFVFARNRLTLNPSTAAVKEGVSKAKAGDATSALAWFRKAAKADPFDPWPSYHAGMTLLHLGRYLEAVESFRTTEAIAPGWYHCRADRWFAEQLAAGAMDHELFTLVRVLIDGGLPPAAVALRAKKALGMKELGLLHLLAGDAMSKLGRGAEAAAEYRRGIAIAEEPDVETRLRYALGTHVEHRSEQQRLLRDAHALNGNLVAAAMAAVVLRKMGVEAG